MTQVLFHNVFPPDYQILQTIVIQNQGTVATVRHKNDKRHKEYFIPYDECKPRKLLTSAIHNYPILSAITSCLHVGPHIWSKNLLTSNTDKAHLLSGWFREGLCETTHKHRVTFPATLWGIESLVPYTLYAWLIFISAWVCNLTFLILALDLGLSLCVGLCFSPVGSGMSQRGLHFSYF